MKILSWVSCVVNLVKKRASRDGGKVLWNWPHVAVWETYVASWLETQPGNILQIKGLIKKLELNQIKLNMQPSQLVPSVNWSPSILVPPFNKSVFAILAMIA